MAIDRMIIVKTNTLHLTLRSVKFEKYLGLVSYLNFRGERDQV